MSALRCAYELLRREALLEVAGRQASVALLPLIAAVAVLAGLAFGPDPEHLSRSAPGVVWLAVLVAAVPLASVVAADERAEGAWDVVRGVVTPGALLLGKVTAAWGALAVAWLLAAGLAVVLLRAELAAAALVGGALGTLGIAVTATTLGVLLGSDTRARLLLAVLLFPLALPALLAGVQTASPLVPAAPWLAVLLAYDLLVIAGATVLFPFLLEE